MATHILAPFDGLSETSCSLSGLWTTSTSRKATSRFGHANQAQDPGLTASSRVEYTKEVPCAQPWRLPDRAHGVQIPSSHLLTSPHHRSWLTTQQQCHHASLHRCMSHAHSIQLTASCSLTSSCFFDCSRRDCAGLLCSSVALSLDSSIAHSLASVLNGRNRTWMETLVEYH